ncbi:MAG: PQQ-binding-like beta-propeller repeat protein, partial [Pedobacter sp.]|nr:PQQ-binding-like beta-propeller repeat protein [Chitinophagaceae bacterium]
YPIAGGNATIFVYNPATNAIIKNITFQGSNAGKIISLNASKIVGCYDDVVYMLDVATGSIIWQQSLGGGQRIFGLVKANTTTFIIDHLYLQATHFKVRKYNLTTATTVTVNNTNIAEFDDADFDESTKPTGLVVTSSNGNFYDLYITGLKAAYRIKSLGNF